MTARCGGGGCEWNGERGDGGGVKDGRGGWGGGGWMGREMEVGM